MSELTTTSFSRLSTYQECSERYRWKYIVKAEEQEPLQEHFIKGSLAHFILEESLAGNEVLEAFDLVLPTWVEETCRLLITDDLGIQQEGQGIYLDTLRHYAVSVSELLLRAAPNYLGPDAIRKKDGKPPENPLEYPPTSFSQAMNEKFLYDDKSVLDIAATRINKDFIDFSLANITAEALFLARNFELPDWFGKTVAIEDPILPEGNESPYKPIGFVGDIFWKGYIDWVFETKEGELVIADHKSSKSAPEGYEVAWHPQLNLYAGLYYEQRGRMPDYIAINHLRTNQIVLAKPDPLAIGQTLEHFRQIQARINSESFVRHYPTEFNTPCVKYDYKTSRVKYICPYLKRCWPYFYEDLLYAKGS